MPARGGRQDAALPPAHAAGVTIQSVDSARTTTRAGVAFGEGIHRKSPSALPTALRADDIRLERNVMGYGRYIGRVGALAVTLGVGMAMAGTPGMAYADPSEGASSSSADSSSKSSSTTNRRGFRCGVEVVIKDEDVGGYRCAVEAVVDEEVVGGHRSGIDRWLRRHRRRRRIGNRRRAPPMSPPWIVTTPPTRQGRLRQD